MHLCPDSRRAAIPGLKVLFLQATAPDVFVPPLSVFLLLPLATQWPTISITMVSWNILQPVEAPTIDRVSSTTGSNRAACPRIFKRPFPTYQDFSIARSAPVRPAGATTWTFTPRATPAVAISHTFSGMLATDRFCSQPRIWLGMSLFIKAHVRSLLDLAVPMNHCGRMYFQWVAIKAAQVIISYT